MATAQDLEAAGHEHIFLGAAHDANARRTLWVVALTTVMMAGEIAAGYWTGSMALLADGFHMATHAGALTVAAAAYAYARRHAGNRRFSFGTGKVGDLSGFASALVLGVAALAIGAESVRRLFEPSNVAFGDAAAVAGLGLAVNVLSALLLSGGHGHHHGHAHGRRHDDHDHRAHDHDHQHQGREAAGSAAPVPAKRGGHDNNLRSAYLHVLADALTSVLAIIALLAGRLLGWTWLDSAMGLVGAVVIARWSWSLMRDTSAVLLDTTDAHVAEEIRDLVEAAGDARITDLHVWKVGPEAHATIVSVVGAADSATIRQRLRPVHEIRHLTIETA